MTPSHHLDLSSNRFLAALPEQAIKSLRPHLQMVPVKLGQVLHWHGDSAQYIYFPTDASISLITTLEGGKAVEVALIGWEGLVGIWGALGSNADWHEAVVQFPGHCLKMKASVFRAELARGGGLMEQLHRYTRYLLAQVSQTAACNRLHRLDQRLARWLLMTHDHARADEFPETHEFLSRILGTDRSEVTIAAGILRKSNLITYSRGRVKVLDRKGLESASCECYRVLFHELTHLVNNIT